MTERRTPGSRALDALVDEARNDLVPPARDWSAVEARLLSRSRRRPWLPAATAALAVAAAAALFVGRKAPVPPPAPIALAAEASLVQSGELTIAGKPAHGGDVLREGDELRADGRVLFDRPAKVTWLVDGPVKAKVKSAGETLILGLEDGAIEAQVVPVKTGEAFAVDLQTAGSLVRVAVHGTHLRVTRKGDAVTVDLTEGVIAIGVPPANGVTTGTEVRAPARVELDAKDLGTMRVIDTGVRAAVALETQPPAKETAAPKTRPLAPRPAPKPREAILAAIRACAHGAAREGAVHVTVSSELELAVSPAGTVTSARFTPPLEPELQACAARAIYSVKLDETGTVTMPIELTF